MVVSSGSWHGLLHPEWLGDITGTPAEHIIIIQKWVTWNWNSHTVVNSNSVKNKSRYLFYIPELLLFSIGAPFKRCVDCTLNKIECDFAKIECLVSSLSLSTRQCKINSLHGNLLWAVLLRQFAVCWGKGSSRYIYHPLPLATIQPTSNHWTEVLMGALALEFHIIIEVQGSKRQVHQGYSSSSLRTGSKVCHWVMGTKDENFAIIKNMVAFLPLFIFFLRVILAHTMSFVLLSESSTHIMSGSLNVTVQSLHNSI